MGSTPVFDSIYTGTLYGRWPMTAVWVSLLPLADARGEINLSYEAITGMTGWPMDLLRQGIEQLCAPDPSSRSSDEEGRRLVPLDPGRQWGWRVVNHAKYRERARLMAKSAQEVAAGKNKQRMDGRRGSTAGDRRSPPGITSDHLSDSEKNKNSRVLTDSDSRPPWRTCEKRPDYESKDFHHQVIAAYHEILPNLPVVKVWSSKRARALNARIRERLGDGKLADGIDYWRRLFAQVGSSDFLCGLSTDFRADLEWLLRPENFAKVIEGRYAPRSPPLNGGAANAG